MNKPLKQQLNEVLCRDYPRFLRKLKQLKPEQETALAQQIKQSVEQVQQRKAAVPVLDYPDLPVVRLRESIRDSIIAHQVLILCGDTGSGKTTQLPKIALEAGRGSRGLIGHTQPRRLAARTVAARIAEELKTPLGQTVGFKVRFDDRSDQNSLVKVMTDGILLAEIQKDPFLNQYDTLIIDEAHERSLNIDFLLGYLKRLLKKRPDLKLIITSATIDPVRFSKHFDDAPLITAEGRSFPVELQYRPLSVDENGEMMSLADAIVESCAALQDLAQGDVLVFLPGERDIREAQEALSKAIKHRKSLRGMEVLPLLARLSTAQQQKIFAAHNARRIVLATNVAETSLTVPGIRYVVDSGLARISRYSVRSKVQRLPIEGISQASAMQRAGRCGRTMPGVCVRLFSEADFNSRAEFTEPEIQRTNLAAVILQLESLRLGALENFPFIEAPEMRYINDGYRLLYELAAVDQSRRLTSLGRKLATLPVDPRLGRMLLDAANNQALDEVLTIVAFLSIQDPRERPMDRQQQADLAHSQYLNEQSDFLSILNLWAYVKVQRDALSQNRFRKLCTQRCLSWMRLREWAEVRSQLQQMMQGLGAQLNTTEASYDNLHLSLLSGLLDHIAIKQDGPQYLTTRNRQLRIFPGSGLAKRGPKWFMAAEVAETSRLYARHVAKIDVEWVEKIAEPLLSYDYYAPKWLKKKGIVGGKAKVSLYGLVINPKKNINYSNLFPLESRQIFIQQALVEGVFETQAGFFAHNQKLIDDVELLEDKQRRRDLLVSPEALYDFYDGIIPGNISTTVAFDQWRKTYETEFPKALYLQPELLLKNEIDAEVDTQFPDSLELGGAVFPLRYHFAPGQEDDGVNVMVPLALLNRIDQRHSSWLVPGLLLQRVTELIRSLPKNLRKHFVPVPDFAQASVEAMALYSDTLERALAIQLKKMTAVNLSETDWSADRLAPHLHMRFEIVDQGKVLGSGRDLLDLQQRFSDVSQLRMQQNVSDQFERDEVVDWNFGDLLNSIELKQQGVRVKAYPALVVEGERVALRAFVQAQHAAYASHFGVRALFKIALKDELKYLRRKLLHFNEIALRFAPFSGTTELKEDLLNAALNQLLFSKVLPRTREQFLTIAAENKATIVSAANEVCNWVHEALALHRMVARRTSGSISLAWVEAVNDIRDQIDHVFYPGCFAAMPALKIKRLAVYFKAMNKRLDSIDAAPDKDRSRRAEILPLWQQIKALELPENDLELLEMYQTLRWDFEELRVAIFAQELGVLGKVSIARTQKQIEAFTQRR